MNESADHQAGKPWFVFEAEKPSSEAIGMAREWAAAKGIEKPLQELIELVCTDPRDPYDLEGCIHLLAWNDDVEIEDLIDLSGAEQLGVLEEISSEAGPYNVMVAVSLRREGEVWTTAGEQQ